VLPDLMGDVGLAVKGFFDEVVAVPIV
jgi:hypothetical protein